MSRFLESYQVVMRTVGPVFIGSGRETNKKEYLFLNRREVGIPDMQKLYRAMEGRGKAEEFERFILREGGGDLSSFLEKQNFRVKDIVPLLRYRLDCGDAVIERGARPHVLECMKDGYGQPYIPGSSIKGMLRSILLGADIIQNPDKYRRAGDSLYRDAGAPAGWAWNSQMQRDIQKIEGIAFRTLNREVKNSDDAVKDSLQGLIVSDSEPLSTDALALCQKVDRHTDGREKNMPILRECIRPDSLIRYTVAVDRKVCKLDERAIREAAGIFMDSCRSNFLAAFAGADMPGEDCVYLGGGSGFVSKTVIYPLCGRSRGLETAQTIFLRNRRIPRVHKHELDQRYGASPHTMKCTRYEGKTLQMGLCRIEEIRRI